MFQTLFNEEIAQHIVSQSNLYAQQKNEHRFSTSEDEMKRFLGILILTGYHQLPRERQYWSLDEDLNVLCVSRRMTRNRFQEMKRFIHLADNAQIGVTDKMFKLRSLMKLLTESFQRWGIFHEALSIDEAMIKYYGRHPTKQFIRGKPIRFGYKN